MWHKTLGKVALRLAGRRPAPALWRRRTWPALMIVLPFAALACATAQGEHTLAPAPRDTTGPSIYGSGIAGNAKGNAEIGRSWGDIALRFRASSSSAPSYLIWPCRTGSGGYSGGNGGIIRIGIMRDDGTAQHHPDGKWLTYTDVKPGNPGSDERFLRTDFSGAPSLVAGQLYHIVFRNISPDPYTDWVSVNNLMTSGSQATPRQPAFADVDLGLLRYGPSNWQSHSTSRYYYTPHFDLTLADGTHEGNAYGFADPNYDRLISGTTQMVRERFTVSGGDKNVTGVYVSIARQSGAGDVTIRLEDSSGAKIDSITVSGSHIASGTPGDAWADTEWLGGAFTSSHTLYNGKTYRLRIHSAPGSTYFARPLFARNRAHTGDDYMRSRHFKDGSSAKYGGGEYTTDGGGSWNGMYHYDLPQDLQFYFVER